LEVVEDFNTDTYRAVKSTKGSATPKRDLDLIDERLKQAKADYSVYEAEKKEKKHAKSQPKRH
jgi:hypothetical protein